MSSSVRRGTQAVAVAAKMLLAFTLVTGLAYTLIMTGFAQAAFGEKADGSLVRDDEGNIVGSSLIGQPFTDQEGEPLPEYFQSRPSAVDYDGAGSGGSNWGPESEDFYQEVVSRQEEIAERENVGVAEIPVDAVTASSSGLDPHISVEYAQIQAPRVAESRQIDLDEVTRLLEEHTADPDLGFLGEARVSVLELNLALDQLHSQR